MFVKATRPHAQSSYIITILVMSKTNAITHTRLPARHIASPALPQPPLMSVTFATHRPANPPTLDDWRGAALSGRSCLYCPGRKQINKRETWDWSGTGNHPCTLTTSPQHGSFGRAREWFACSFSTVIALLSVSFLFSRLWNAKTHGWYLIAV